MQIEFVFELRSQLMLADGPWPPLAFRRGEFGVHIDKPEVFQLPFIRLDALRADTDLRQFRSEPGLAVTLSMANVRVLLELDRDVERADILAVFQDLAMTLLGELKSWIRVLARQYWVGFKQSSGALQHFHVNRVNESGKEPISNAGCGPAYEYWKVIDADKWQQIGEKMAAGERPRPGQLFFCAGLLEISELNMAQAIIDLGASCDLELLAVLLGAERSLAASRKPIPTDLQNPESLRFGERLSLVGRLSAVPFSRHNPNADRLIRELYGLRGDAIHRSSLPIEDETKSAPANTSKLLPYVEACESLFDWLNSQRGPNTCTPSW